MLNCLGMRQKFRHYHPRLIFSAARPDFPVGRQRRLQQITLAEAAS